VDENSNKIHKSIAPQKFPFTAVFMPFSTAIELDSGPCSHLDVATWPFEIEPCFLIQTCEVNFCGLGFRVGKLCGFHPFLF